MRSSPQPHDLCLLNPAISAYSAVRYVPDSRLRSTVSRLISDYQPLDQHLSTILSAPVSRLISTCQQLDQHLSAALSAPISCLISPCQHLDQRLKLSTHPIEKQKLKRVNSIFQPVDLCLLSPAVSAYTAARSVLVSRLTSSHTGLKAPKPRSCCGLYANAA